MAVGAAGTEAVDTALRAGLTLVLIHYGAVNLAALRGGRRRIAGRPSVLFLLSSPWSRAGAAIAFAIGAVLLVAGDPDKVAIIELMTSAVVAVFILVFCGFWASGGRLRRGS